MAGDVIAKAPAIELIALAIVAVGLAARVGVGLANAYWLYLPHLDDFHHVASFFSTGEITRDFGVSYAYAYVLGLVYGVTGPHEIVGYLGSALAWAGAALALDAMLRLLRAAPSARVAALLIFALTPSSIYFGSVIMRDVYELLFITLMMLAALRIYVERDYDAAVPMVLAGAALTLLHKGLMPWSVIAAVSVLACVLAMHRERVAKQALVAVLVLAFSAFATAMFMRFGYDLSEGVTAAVGSYRDNVQESTPRTLFQLLDQFAASGGLIGILVGLVQYMLEPVPWHVEGLGDLIVMVENAVRLVLIGMAVWAVIVDRQRRVPILLLLFVYCCLEGIWSLGTVAWGTAIRHHLTGSALLLVAAFASFRFEGRGSQRRVAS